jgi:hypothetical protein
MSAASIERGRYLGEKILTKAVSKVVHRRLKITTWHLEKSERLTALRIRERRVSVLQLKLPQHESKI